MLDLKIIKQFRAKERNQFNFASQMQNIIINNRTRDLDKLNKRLKFVREIKDIIYGYQDVINPEEMMLYDYYEQYELEILKTLQKECEEK